jgi:hypothetical protein
MTDAGLRRLYRQEYLRQHAEQRRAAAKAASAKRIDVTLQGDALDKFEQVRAWLDRNNRTMIKLGVYNKPRTLPDGRMYTIPAPPLSATEIIRTALMLAVGKIEDDERGH